MTQTAPPVHLKLRGRIDEATERFANRAALTAAHLFGVTIGAHLRQLRSLGDPLAELHARLQEAELKARLGRWVALVSYASNLATPSDPNTFSSDVFRVDLRNGHFAKVSVASDGTPAEDCGSLYPTISRDGRKIAFSSCASNLVSGDTNNQWDAFVRGSLPSY